MWKVIASVLAIGEGALIASKSKKQAGSADAALSAEPVAIQTAETAADVSAQTDDYPTNYNGHVSDALDTIRVSGVPVSGRAPTLECRPIFDSQGHVLSVKCKDATGRRGKLEHKGDDIEKMSVHDYLNDKKRKERIGNIEKWKQTIHAAVQNALAKSEFHNVPSQWTKATGCYLFITFRMAGDPFTVDRQGASLYQTTDLDNLLKPVLDALHRAVEFTPAYKKQSPALIRLIKDDKYVKGIKVRKERCSKGNEEVRIKCIATKTFKILEVAPKVSGSAFMSHWKNPMQYITAQEVGREGEWHFIDNAPGCIFVSNDNLNFPDAIPGYQWHKGATFDGCVVTKRVHKEENETATFHWLQKWAW